MNVSSEKIFPSYNILATYNSNGSLTQLPRLLYSAGAIAATRDRPRCSVAVERFPRRTLAAMVASLPLSCARSRVTEIEKLHKVVNSIMSPGSTHGSDVEEERLKKLINAKEKTAKIHVYVQDALGGSNPTVWEVARSVQTANSPTTFGQVRVLDDLVTAGADRNSEKLGRAQGIITFSDLSESALTMNLTFYFNGGEHKGSSICIGGRNPINNKDRELPIIGGTGVFLMARGYSISNTFSFDPVSNYGVLEYTFYVAYPDHQE